MNKHRNIHTVFELPRYTLRLSMNDRNSLLIDIPDDPVSYWYVDTFVKVASDPLFKDLKFLKIHDIYKLITLKFVYESVNELNPNQFHTYYNYPTDVYNTAANRGNYLDPPMVRTVTYGLKSLKYTGCILWNNLSINIRNVLSINIFNNMTKKNIIDHY